MKIKAEHKDGSAINRKEWDEGLQNSREGMLYLLSGFMDQVAPGWSAIEVRRDGKLMAGMPLFIKKKWGLQYAFQAPFAQFWGIWTDSKYYPGTTVYKDVSHYRKVQKAIIDAIPPGIRLFNYNFSPEYNYPLPFHWHGYELRQRITYHLDLNIEEEALHKDLASDLRYDLRRNADVETSLSLEPDHLLALVRKNRTTSKELMPQEWEAILHKLSKWLLQSGNGEIRTAHKEGKLIAAALIGKYQDKRAYLASAIEPEYRNSGVMVKLLWDCILHAKAENAALFDFEGSMIESIEAFFRGFSASPKSYLNIQKNNLPLLLRWIRK